MLARFKEDPTYYIKIRVRHDEAPLQGSSAAVRARRGPDSASGRPQVLRYRPLMPCNSFRQFKPIIVKMPNQNIEIVYGWKELFKEQSRDTHKTQNDCKRRKGMKASEQMNDGGQYACARGDRRCASG
ncbi:hypothetical protein EVAR_15886_1 [Eumeta japonica]|uniref:Uncharacterized protein n=1 Tax=Eumeta variegata TaxID=151549 RepID=A0A4C1UEX7_EUMVA|nr:hypothetical protein EVAR_15886_1 [Eumeta japonica]